MTEFSVQNKVKKGDLIAFSLLIVTFLALICYIIISSTPDTNVKITQLNDSSVTLIVSHENLQDDLININTANVSLLTKLDKIGEVKAQAIIDYREQNGPFKKKEEIMNVPGIGEGIFKAIENYIEV